MPQRTPGLKSQLISIFVPFQIWLLSNRFVQWRNQGVSGWAIRPPRSRRVLVAIFCKTVGNFCKMGGHFCKMGGHFCKIGEHFCKIGRHFCKIEDFLGLNRVNLFKKWGDFLQNKGQIKNQRQLFKNKGFFGKIGGIFCTIEGRGKLYYTAVTTVRLGAHYSDGALELLNKPCRNPKSRNHV